jgi:hypothetical protein
MPKLTVSQRCKQSVAQTIGVQRRIGMIRTRMVEIDLRRSPRKKQTSADTKMVRAATKYSNTEIGIRQKLISPGKPHRKVRADTVTIAATAGHTTQRSLGAADGGGAWPAGREAIAIRVILSPDHSRR